MYLLVSYNSHKNNFFRKQYETIDLYDRNALFAVVTNFKCNLDELGSQRIKLYL
jgi:hypothetical protein